MKKILFALGMIGLISTGANAQEGKSANSKFAQNYPVCMTGSGYKVCSPEAAATPAPATVVKPNSASLSMVTSSVHMGSSTRKVSRMRVVYDDPHAPYEGKESMVNDGVQKNIVRNINYLDQSVVLPANDGGLSNK